MKKFTVLLLPFLFCMITVFCQSSQNEKIYIFPGQLGVTTDGIFVNLNEQWFEVKAVSSDENGIYVQNPIPQEAGCREGYVPCRNCDRCVKWYYDICPLCHKPV